MKTIVSIAFGLCINTGVGAYDLARPDSLHLATVRGQATTVRPIALGTISPLGAILFRTDSAEVDQTLWPILQSAAMLATKYPALVIELAGYSDVRGSRNHNHTLSFRRTESVAAFFIRNGISPKRIQILAYGERRASANITNTGGQFFDRRVTITLRAQDNST